MGHFTHNCKLTGLPILSSDKAILIVMMKNKSYFRNFDKEYGTTYDCSNDATRLKYIPVWLPIRGEYSGYGSLDNIIEDDNTKMLEKHYGLTIDQIMDIVCSGRKDDGFDKSLDVIKDTKFKPEYPSDWKKGEGHIEYFIRTHNINMLKDDKWIDKYSEWKKENPDPEHGVKYLSKYEDLVSYSGMWIHGDVYDELTKNAEKSPMFRALKADPTVENLNYYLLGGTFPTYRIQNHFAKKYEKLVKNTFFKIDLAKFWLFDDYLYCCGRYYDTVGTAPQDGELDMVKKVLDVSLKIVNKNMDKYGF